jgi:hypothetical protein
MIGRKGDFLLLQVIAWWSSVLIVLACLSISGIFHGISALFVSGLIVLFFGLAALVASALYIYFHLG